MTRLPRFRVLLAASVAVGAFVTVPDIAYAANTTTRLSATEMTAALRPGAIEDELWVCRAAS